MHRQMLTRGRAAVAAAVVLVVGLAGCSSSDDKKDTDNNESGSATTLKIASVATQQYFGENLPVGVKTRLDMANADKELPDYSFDYLGLIDDQGTPDGTAAAYRKAKEKDGVFAVVGGVSAQPPTEYVNQQKLPVVATAQADAYCTHGATTTWYWFSTTGCALGFNNPYGINLGEPVAALVGDASGKTAACAGEDFPGADVNIVKLCDAFAAAGAEVTYTDASIPAPPAVVSDYSPYVQKLMTANDGEPADFVGLGTSPGGSVGLAQGLVNSGFEGIMISGAGYSVQQTQALKGVTEWSNTATPLSAASTPEMQKIMDSFEAAGVSADKVDAYSIGGWLAADMFLKVLKAAGADASTEDFAKAAAAFTYEIEGVVGPTTYPTAFAALTPCSELSQSDGEQWTVVRPYTCDKVYRSQDGSLIDYSEVDPAEKY